MVYWSGLCQMHELTLLIGPYLDGLIYLPVLIRLTRISIWNFQAVPLTTKLERCALFGAGMTNIEVSVITPP